MALKEVHGPFQLRVPVFFREFTQAGTAFFRKRLQNVFEGGGATRLAVELDGGLFVFAGEARALRAPAAA